jgi:hypothetical protein
MQTEGDSADAHVSAPRAEAAAVQDAPAHAEMLTSTALAAAAVTAPGGGVAVPEVPVAAARFEYEWSPDCGAESARRPATDANVAQSFEKQRRRGKVHPADLGKALENRSVSGKGKIVIQIDPADWIAACSGLIAIMFAVGMNVGHTPITEGTLGVVGFSGLQTAIFGTQSAWKRWKKRKRSRRS